MLQLTGTRPIPGVMFGLTHDEDGAVIIREARILKVGIGLPRGRAINCWIHNDGKWYFRIGKMNNGKLEFTTAPKTGLANAVEAERFYRENYSKADVANYPRKLQFFTFTRPVIDNDGNEVFEPDFQAIEAHGQTPTAIDIVHLDDNPFTGAYQMWSTSELRCKGDGINAMRVLSMASTDEEKRLATAAKDAGERYFPIIQGCWTKGCPYSKETTDDKGRTIPSPCKPGADLKFQLARNIRVGGTAYFHTSGIRSITQMHSSLERIKSLTGGRLAGIPLKMTLRPYKTRHNGQPATQYGVSLEFRAEDIDTLRKNLIEQAFRFRQLPDAPRRMLEAGTAEQVIEDSDDEEAPTISAQAMTDEFYAEEAESGPSPSTTPASASAATATEQKTADLAAKLKAQSEGKPPEQPKQEQAKQRPLTNPEPGDMF